MPSERDVQRAIAAALAEAGRARGWEDLDAYLAYHLSAHAAAGGTLDDLVREAGFLAATDPARLLRVLGQVDAEAAHAYVRLYVRAVHRLRGRTPTQRAMALDMAGHEQGWGARLSVGWAGVVWSTSWTRWQPSQEMLTLARHTGSVSSVALGEVDGQPVVATASGDGTARLWDARSGEVLRSLEGHTDSVSGVALGEVDGQPVVATASGDGTARLWDARSGAEQVLFPLDASAHALALGEARLVLGCARGLIVLEGRDAATARQA